MNHDMHNLFIAYALYIYNCIALPLYLYIVYQPIVCK